MNTLAAVSPPGSDSSIWLQRRTVLLPVWLPSAGHASLISTRRTSQKGVICCIKTAELSKKRVNQTQDAIQRLQTVEKDKLPENMFEADVKTLTKSFNALKTSKADVPSNPAAATVSRSKTSGKERNPKKLNSSAAQAIMPLGFVSIFRQLLVTEAAMKQMVEFNTLVFKVDRRADKDNIKDAFLKMFRVKARKVNTSILPDGSKKAFIMLAPEFKAADVAKKMKFM